MMEDIQTLELVDRRWPALLSGEKLDTIRLNEGEVELGLLRYIACDDKTKQAYVWVTHVEYMPLKAVPNEPDKDDLLRRMKMHYPNIELDTEILFVAHLSVEQTKEKYGDLL